MRMFDFDAFLDAIGISVGSDIPEDYVELYVLEFWINSPLYV